jgi:small subunit ribosomal protein S1
MSENYYRPEGCLIGTAENREYTSSLNGLERAVSTGKILEATAIMCDSELRLTVDLNIGGIKVRAYIPKEESVYCEGEIKDIAVITRVGKAVCFKILALERDANGVVTAVLSRRAAQIECMRNYLLTLVRGDIIPAKITHLEHFGAFADIGCGIVSLMSIDCISVSRISHPKDRFSVGMAVRAVVKSIDYETGRIYITHKELLGTWQENADMFVVGQTVAGIVRSVEEYGIFVELTPNLAGLAEFKEDIIPGQTAAVYIKNIIPERMKIKLVLIDSYRGELVPRKMDYYIGDEYNHMDYWVYSPKSCVKLIETNFLEADEVLNHHLLS